MRALLDANVLIALLDPDHTFHKRAQDWAAVYLADGWASCPITENAAVRILSNPNYSKTRRFSAEELVYLLREFVQTSDHQFWTDDISILNASLFSTDRIHGPRQLTDTYLLALAVSREGRLVTFDEAIPLSAVVGAKRANLYII